jgi:hypothetical protein
MAAVCYKCGENHLTHRCPQAIEAASRKRKSYAEVLLGSTIPNAPSFNVNKDKHLCASFSRQLSSNEYSEEIKELQNTISILKEQVRLLSEEISRAKTHTISSSTLSTVSSTPRILSRNTPLSSLDTTNQCSSPPKSFSRQSNNYRLAIAQLKKTKSVKSAIQILEEMDTATRDMDDHMIDVLGSDDDAMSPIYV